jgi:hypothetical protein
VPDSDAITFNSAGTWYWQAAYSGDANNNGATSACVSETLTVNPNSPTIGTTLSGSNVAIGTAVHDSATLTGATAAAGGTVTYLVYTNATCTTGAQSAGVKTVTNHLVPDSDAITFNSAGTWYWQAAYSGDANNNGATSACVSETLTVNKIAQTITFAAAPTGVTVGASGVSVSAIASSALPVAYSSTTLSICTVDSSTGALTLLAVGTCTIAADQAGNGTYTAAPQVTQDVAVAVAPAPHLSLLAAAVEPNFTAAGDILHFTFTLTNTGNTVLDGPFQVTSDKIAVVTCPATATLALGATIVCTGTYTVTLADMDAGKVVNTATATGQFREASVASTAVAVTVTQKPLETVLAATATPSPTESVGAVTAAPVRTNTPPPTSTGGSSSGTGSTPLFALLIGLAFASLGLLAVQAQRRTLRR